MCGSQQQQLHLVLIRDLLSPAGWLCGVSLDNLRFSRSPGNRSLSKLKTCWSRALFATKKPLPFMSLWRVFKQESEIRQLRLGEDALAFVRTDRLVPIDLCKNKQTGTYSFMYLL